MLTVPEPTLRVWNLGCFEKQGSYFAGGGWLTFCHFQRIHKVHLRTPGKGALRKKLGKQARTALLSHDTPWQRKPNHKPLKTLRTFPLISAHTDTGLRFSSHNVTSMTERKRLKVKKEKTKPHGYCFNWKKRRRRNVEEVVCIHSFIHMSLWKMSHLRKVSRLPLNPLNGLIQCSLLDQSKDWHHLQKTVFFHLKFNQSNTRAGIKKWEILHYSFTLLLCSHLMGRTKCISKIPETILQIKVFPNI